MGNKAFDWCLPTEPDPTIDGRTMQWAAGKALGGSSSINGQVYMRGARSDYDRWAAMGCTGWGYDDIFPYFLKAEIGRASCRARVCQYVYMSVVAGSLKTKRRK